MTLAIWDHIYRDNYGRHHDRPTPGRVWGLTGDNLKPFTYAALRKFFKLVPGTDSIQLRMHTESGLKEEEMSDFWTGVYQVIKETRPGIRVDARAKDFPDSLIDKALNMGINLRISTKYHMEHLGLPFHPTHIPPPNQFERRHGYADLLRYPKRYEMHWRVWTSGTLRVLLWGDPEFVRRFAESTHLYGDGGFEINEPLATKMQTRPHEMEPFELLKKPYQYYDWEFERYWHLFQVFGRVTYNPDTPPEVWHKEFERRFGQKAGLHVERALHLASWVLPQIVESSLPYHLFPTTRGWPGKQRMGDVAAYSRLEPSDPQQFLSVDEEARNILEGKHSPKRRPQENSAWFAQRAEAILDEVKLVEQHITGENKELTSTIIDLKMLAHLARYHTHRIQSGLSYALFRRSGDVNALDDTIAHEKQAVKAYETLALLADNVYTENLFFGRAGWDLVGHWMDEYEKLEQEFEMLKEQREEFTPIVTDEPHIAHVPVRRTKPGPIEVRATISGRHGIAGAQIGYRHHGDDYQFISMSQSKPHCYSGIIPASAVREGLAYYLEAEDKAGGKQIWPPPGNPGGDEQAFEEIQVMVTNDRQAPDVTHQPVRSALPETPLTVRAQVRDLSGVEWVRLRYRSVNQHQDYRTLPMQLVGRSGHYEAVVPAGHIVPRWDFMYFLEVMDTKGNGAIHPDLDKETPYIVVKLDRDSTDVSPARR